MKIDNLDIRAAQDTVLTERICNTEIDTVSKYTIDNLKNFTAALKGYSDGINGSVIELHDSANLLDSATLNMVGNNSNLVKSMVYLENTVKNISNLNNMVSNKQFLDTIKKLSEATSLLDKFSEYADNGTFELLNNCFKTIEKE